MKNCKKCGAQNATEARFCVDCGSQEFIQPQQKKKSKGKIILAVIAGLIVLGAIGNLISPPETDTNTTTTETTTKTTTTETTPEPTTTLSPEEELAAESGVSIDTIKSIQDAASKIGISEITSIVPGDDWDQGKIYTMFSDLGSHSVYLTADETINSINMSTIKLFENGEPIRSAKDFYLSEMDQMLAMGYAEDAIKALLKAPSTAKFPGHIMDAADWSYGWKEEYPAVFFCQSHVDAENSFGAMIRSEFQVGLMKIGEAFSPVYIFFEGQEVLNLIDE